MPLSVMQTVCTWHRIRYSNLVNAFNILWHSMSMISISMLFFQVVSNFVIVVIVCLLIVYYNVIVVYAGINYLSFCR